MEIAKERKRWARQLKAERAKKKISQEDLARESIYSLSYIQKVENAARGTAKSVAELLSVVKKYRKAS